MTAKALTWIGVALAIAACRDRSEPVRGHTVNAVIGDASWTLDRPPRDETERIATHLRYVADRLDAAPPALPPAIAARRRAAIATLRGYAERGVFPRLDAPGPRTPRFVDRAGTLCAVGFLIASTDGEAVARELGARYEYAYLDDIADPRIDAWAAANGLTRRELAMIQPEYAPEPACDPWGHPNRPPDDCADDALRHRRWLYGFGLGGGASRAGGRDLSYFLWGGDVRYALASWLAIGLGDLGVRAGPDAVGNHVALAATPLVELSRWSRGRQRDALQFHLDLGVTAEQVVRGDGPQHPLAAELALGVRVMAPDVAEPEILIGAAIAVRDGFVIDERVPAGSVMPFVRVAFGWRP
ncbi:MAG TPA: hypothetical protein VLX92_05520 [Kofleriaceae bacterium]|nr:hypothetical protein [Kofleriaceae bacterium]